MKTKWTRSTSLLLLALLAACTGVPGVPDEPGVPVEYGLVTLAQGEAITLPDGVNTLVFLDVVNDSRCPADAVCVTGGQVQVAFEMSGPATQLQFVLTQGDLHNDDTTTLDLGGVVIELSDVQPYPLASVERTAPWQVTVLVSPSDSQ